jgi:hypothetical protein
VIDGNPESYVDYEARLSLDKYDLFGFAFWMRFWNLMSEDEGNDSTY